MRSSSECDLSSLILGPGFKVYACEKTEETTVLFAESLSLFAVCPDCGRRSVEDGDNYTRTVQDIPLQFKTTFAVLKVKIYTCSNRDCKRKTFAEKIPFVEYKQRKSTELHAFALLLSIFMGNNTLSIVLKKLGFSISASAIGRLWAKINLRDNPNIGAVGIDDIALDKGQDYATAIYDLLTHDLIALLSGRDGETLKEWLLEHQKILLVARDRDSSLSAAIDTALPDALQVADRFHLIQNIISYVRDAVMEIIPGTLIFKDDKLIEGQMPKEWLPTYPLDSEEVAKLSHYNNEPLLDPSGKPVAYDNKKRELESKQYKELEENRKKRVETIRQIQLRYNELSKTISKESKIISQLRSETGKTASTIRKYLRMTEAELQWKENNPNVHKKKKTPMDAAHNIIFKMLTDGVDPALIYSAVQSRFPDVKQTTVMNHIAALARNNFSMKLMRGFALTPVVPEGYTKIKRSDLIKLITKIDKKDKSEPKTEAETKDDVKLNLKYEEIVQAFPELSAIKESYLEFHRIIMGDDPGTLDEFLTKHEDSFLSGLVKGIKKDIAAVKNAISFPVSSGLVEGGNHKVKLIKRIGYGKYSLKNLLKKCFAAFRIDSDDFNVESILADFTI